MRKRKYSALQEGEETVVPEDAPVPMIHNIVATSQIQGTAGTLDLANLYRLMPFSFFDKGRFAAITIRLSQPDCTTLLFASGKLVVTGGKSMHECVYSSLYIARLLEDCLPGERFRLVSCEIQNIVGHVEIPMAGAGRLDIKAMYARLALNCTYQRKMFPGLIYRPSNSPVVLLCFYSGKVVITGGKLVSDIHNGWNRLWPVVKEFVVAT
jgi:transcription initiation factor TFIID TATA-box-binding protein